MSAAVSPEPVTEVRQSVPGPAANNAPREELSIAGPDKFMLVLLMVSLAGLAIAIVGSSVVSLFLK